MTALSAVMCGFDRAPILSLSFHGLRKERLAQWPPLIDENPRGEVLRENLGGGVWHAS